MFIFPLVDIFRGSLTNVVIIPWHPETSAWLFPYRYWNLRPVGYLGQLVSCIHKLKNLLHEFRGFHKFKHLRLIQSDFDGISRLYALDMKGIRINLGLACLRFTLSPLPFKKTCFIQLFKHFQRNTFGEKKSD